MDFTGYDGQSYFFIALDPARAYHYLDMPSYRYTRVLYAMVSRLVAANQTALIPYTLILVNVLAVTGGTLALACWLGRKGVSPWLAALYGYYPGLFTATSLDTAEPLAYGLVALAVYLLATRGRLLVITAGVAFSLAALTRESTLVFPAVYALAILIGSPARGARPMLLNRRLRDASILLGLAAIPFIGYKVFLTHWLGATGLTDYSLLQFPLSGLFGKGSWDAWDVQAFRSIVVPALLCAGMAAWALWRRVWTAEVWLVLQNVWLFVLSLQSESFDPFRAPARIATGVVVAALLCVPDFDSLARAKSIVGSRWWLIACGLLWLWLDVDWLQELLQIYTGCGQAGYGWAVALVYHCPAH
jgi:hypothetical protein